MATFLEWLLRLDCADVADDRAYLLSADRINGGGAQGCEAIADCGFQIADDLVTVRIVWEFGARAIEIPLKDCVAAARE